MASIQDDRGYNQEFAPSKSALVRSERRAARILSEMKTTAETRILEIGCGTGRMAYWLAAHSPAQILGVDLCSSFIEKARESYQASNLVFDVLDFNHPDSLEAASFDYIIGDGILHHLADDLEKTFAAVQRLLKPGGKIIFLEPNLENPYVYLIFSYHWLRKLARLEPSEMAFSRRDIIGLLTRVGFEGVQVEYRDFLVPGIPKALIVPSVWIGSVLERIPIARTLSQSLFIRAYLSASDSGSPSAGNIVRKISFLIRYGIAGITGSVIQAVFLFIWVTILGLEDTYLVGLSIGFVFALITAFFLQKHWTFKDHERSRIPKQLASYAVVALSGLALNGFLLAGAREVFDQVGVDFFGGWYIAVQSVLVVVVSVWAFFLNFFITFRHARKERTWEDG